MQEIKIPNPSNDLLLEVVRTLISPMGHWVASLVVDGISEPNINNADNLQNYFRECSDMGIIPYSQLNLRYEDKTKMFLPREIYPYTFDIYRNEREKEPRQVKINEKIMGSLINGGRPYQINIGNKFGGRGGPEAFEHFRNSFLDQLIKAGYVLSKGEFLPTYKYFSEVSFNTTSLELTIDELDGEFKKLSSQLKEKYERKNLNL